jgi:hypothetical protein
MDMIAVCLGWGYLGVRENQKKFARRKERRSEGKFNARRIGCEGHSGQ